MNNMKAKNAKLKSIEWKSSQGHCCHLHVELTFDSEYPDTIYVLPCDPETSIHECIGIDKDCTEAELVKHWLEDTVRAAHPDITMPEIVIPDHVDMNGKPVWTEI